MVKGNNFVAKLQTFSKQRQWKLKWLPLSSLSPQNGHDGSLFSMRRSKHFLKGLCPVIALMVDASRCFLCLVMCWAFLGSRVFSTCLVDCQSLAFHHLTKKHIVGPFYCNKFHGWQCDWWNKVRPIRFKSSTNVGMLISSTLPKETRAIHLNSEISKATNVPFCLPSAYKCFVLTSMNLSGTSWGSSIPNTFSQTSPGVVVVRISPSDVVLVDPGVVLAGVVGTVDQKY